MENVSALLHLWKVSGRPCCRKISKQGQLAGLIRLLNSDLFFVRGSHQATTACLVSGAQHTKQKSSSCRYARACGAALKISLSAWA